MPWHDAIPAAFVHFASVMASLILINASYFFPIPEPEIRVLPPSVPIVVNKPADVPVPIVKRGIPVRIRIPRLNIDVSVEPVGLTSDGAMGVPKRFTETGWLKSGPKPGEPGNAVIDGHFGWIGKSQWAFDDLHRLRKKDSVFVLDEHGATVEFIVKALKKYEPTSDASELFVSDG